MARLQTRRINVGGTLGPNTVARTLRIAHTLAHTPPPIADRAHLRHRFRFALRQSENRQNLTELVSCRRLSRIDGLRKRRLRLRPEESDDVKFLVSNAPGGTPLEWLVYAAYFRWSIEPCFKEEKDELGFDHFEVRGWRSTYRHMALTQVSHLYLNKMREQLIAEEHAEEKAGVFPYRDPDDDRRT